MGATWRKGLLEWFGVIQGAGGHNFKGQFLSRSASASSRYHKSSERLQGHWANLYYLLATKDPKQARVIWSLSSLYNRMGETTAAFPAWIFFFFGNYSFLLHCLLCDTIARLIEGFGLILCVSFL